MLQNYLDSPANIFLALILGGDFFTGSVLAAALTKLVLRFNGLSSDSAASNTLRAESMLIMASIIRVGQSKFVSAPIDEDSNERIMNCIQTLSELIVAQPTEKVVKEAFLDDTKEAYTKMLGAQEVCLCIPWRRELSLTAFFFVEARSGEEAGGG